jgi:hypothetical protein
LKPKSIGRYILEYVLCYGAIVVFLLYRNIHVGIVELVVLPSLLSLVIVFTLAYFSKPLRRYIRRISDPRYKTMNNKKNAAKTIKENETTPK